MSDQKKADKPSAARKQAGKMSASITLLSLDLHDAQAICSGKTKLPPCKWIVIFTTANALKLSWGIFKDGSTFSSYRGGCLWKMIARFWRQDARRSLAISSGCFSILARWRGHCRRGRELSSGSQSVGKLLACLGMECARNIKEFLSKSRVLLLLCARSSSEGTHIHTLISPLLCTPSLSLL